MRLDATAVTTPRCNPIRVPRLTLQFPERLDRILNDLAEQDETTKVEVVRLALALYDFIRKETHEEGRKLSVTDDKGGVLKIIAFM